MTEVRQLADVASGQGDATPKGGKDGAESLAVAARITDIELPTGISNKWQQGHAWPHVWPHVWGIAHL